MSPGLDFVIHHVIASKGPEQQSQSRPVPVLQLALVERALLNLDLLI